MPQTVIMPTARKFTLAMPVISNSPLSAFCSLEPTRTTSAMAAAAAIADVVLVGSKLQNAESGEFDITGIANVNFLAVGIITVCGIVLFVVCRLIAKHKKA